MRVCVSADHFVDGTEDLLDLTDLLLVLEEDGRVEVRNLVLRRLAHHLALARVEENTNL